MICVYIIHTHNIYKKIQLVTAGSFVTEEYPYRYVIKSSAPTPELCKYLKYAGEQLEQPTTQDVENIIRAGDAFISILMHAGGQRTIKMYWPRERNKYNMYGNDLGGQCVWRNIKELAHIDDMPGTLAQNQRAFYFRLPPNEYQKIIYIREETYRVNRGPGRLYQNPCRGWIRVYVEVFS